MRTRQIGRALLEALVGMDSNQRGVLDPIPARWLVGGGAGYWLYPAMRPALVVVVVVEAPMS